MSTNEPAPGVYSPDQLADVARERDALREQLRLTTVRPETSAYVAELKARVEELAAELAAERGMRQTLQRERETLRATLADLRERAAAALRETDG